MMGQMLFAAGGDSITLHGVTYYGTWVGANCSVSYTISGFPTCEEVLTNEFGAYTSLGQWLIPVANSALYQVRMTLTSGTFTSGTVSSWLPMTAGYTWTTARTTVGIKQTIATVEISDVLTSTVRSSATVNLTAERA